MKKIIFVFVVLVLAALVLNFSTLAAVAGKPTKAQAAELDKLVTACKSDTKTTEACLKALRTATAKDEPAAVLPTEMVIAGRVYEILAFHKDGEDCIGGNTIVERAKSMDANLGEDDGQWLLKYQDQIPVALRGKVGFVFTDWRQPDDSSYVADISWRGGHWIHLRGWLNGGVWDDSYRILRRRK